MLYFQAQAGQASLITGLLPFILLFVIFYFLLIRPQQQQQKKRNEMLRSLRKGNRVVTVGGIFGEIVGITDETIKLKVTDRVELLLSRSSVNQVLESKTLPAVEEDGAEESEAESGSSGKEA
ncbi:preprotein translocase subunit YajC [Limnochorda pilosa]|uniref:Preprotein translocase subunit YajC n=1 Tax=Limnochorda pilosa TaxID=1555112 RepID=A0A0K2SMX4_LIMPI|nr:preprotein translocase subunit YajC [Limnochorda pilosa]BAS28470.1 preprotein translocase subunit YajC [Limnochorda pilosa]